jgi:hypothetical protein
VVAPPQSPAFWADHKEWHKDPMTGAITPMDRQGWKEAIREGLENAGSDRKAYEPAFIQAFGPGSGVLMSQLFF